MAIYAQNNLYSGVNPHLNSALQTRGTRTRPSLWEGFHSAHIGHIRLYLNRLLPPNYVAYSEQSLQIAGEDEFTMGRPRPDISITQKSRQPFTEPPPSVITPTWEAEVWEALEPVEEWMAVVIREVSGGVIGRVVARIELLSPGNKPGGAHYSAYKARRYECVTSGIPLIEVDFLHESRPVVPKHPVYPEDEGSHPYYVSVSDPRPEHSKTQVFGFDVGQSLPPVSVPLAGKEAIVTDFDAIYQAHFEQDRLYVGVDYSLLPERFGTYSPKDQAYIRERMKAIAAEYPQNGAPTS